MTLINYLGSQKFTILSGDVRKLLNIARTMIIFVLKKQPREKLRIFEDILNGYDFWGFGDSNDKYNN